MNGRALGWVLAALGLALGVGAPVSAQEEGDFDPGRHAWNGLSRFVELARAEGITVETPAELDLGTLAPTDGLLVLEPRTDAPAQALNGFMRAGGRLALADDFGRGDTVLRTFGIGRGRPNRTGALELRGNDELLVARPGTAHPLSAGVAALVTNHPQVVYHPDLAPVFAFGDGRDPGDDALVLTGEVPAESGSGRLVVLADPSVLIDNMLELGGNRRFATNLATYLAGEHGRLVIAAPGTRMVGRFGEPGAGRPLHDLRTALEDLSEVNLPPEALKIAAAALAGIALVLAAGLLPRRSPYAGAAMFARPSVPGGFAGRLEWFSAHPASLADPAMVYKNELETELVQRLGLPRRTGVPQIVERMRQRGVPSGEVARARTLLSELARLSDEIERGTRGDTLGEARFRHLVREGEQVLGAVPPGRVA